MDERLATLEDKIANIQVTLDLLPDTLTRYYTLYRHTRIISRHTIAMHNDTRVGNFFVGSP